MTLSVQLFSARNHTPWDGVLDQVRANGYDAVEGFGAVYDDPAAFRAALDARGLTMPTGHFGLDLLEEDMPRALHIARTLGVKTIIAPWLHPDARPTTRAGWEAIAARLATLTGVVQGEGLGFGWHNHDFEFAAVEDGTIPMDILLDQAPDMDWEADLGWIFRAGRNPVDWLAARADRIVAVHLKDVTGLEAESGWADLGHGLNDWTAVFAALRSLPRLSVQVAEHDNPSDLGRFLRRWKAAQAALS